MSSILPASIRAGDTIRVHYTTRTPAGGVVESSLPREPLEFQAGGPEVISGLSRAVLGMRLGERKTVTVLPDDAFGYREAKWQQTLPREVFSERVEEGDQLIFYSENKSFDVWVRSLQGTEVTLDANHPLAGETLVYDLQIVGHGPLNCSPDTTPVTAQTDTE